jgi:PKD repeat protein
MRKVLGIAAYVAIVCLAIPAMAFAQAVVSVDPPEIQSPEVGQQFEVSINITGGVNVAGYQFTLTFDETAVTYISIANADYLPAGAFAVPPKVEPGQVTLAATALGGSSNGDGTLATGTFEVVAVKDSDLGLTGVALSDPGAQSLDVTVQGGKITGGAQPNQAPVAVINAPAEAAVGESISLGGGDSTDDSAIATYAWDFGDSSTGEGETVTHAYSQAGDFTVTLTVTDDGEPAMTGIATVIVKVTEAQETVITEHTPGGKVLSLKANVLAANAPAQCFIPLWEGEMDIEAGMFVEYQATFSLLSVHKLGGVYAHTADGQMIGAVADAGTEWTHRKVSLDELAGQQIVAITLGTDNGAEPQNPAGPFSMMVDNVQITNEQGILVKVWVGLDNINGQPSVTDTFGDAIGVENCEAAVIQEEVAVHPQGKKVTTWGRLKATR